MPDGQPPAGAGDEFAHDAASMFTTRLPMNPDARRFLRSWPVAPWLSDVCSFQRRFISVAGGRYSRRDPERWHVGRLAAFLGGLAAIFLALASPIEPFASLLLQVHMLQHLLLMMVAPPLIWLGWPMFPVPPRLACADSHRLGSRRCFARASLRRSFAVSHPSGCGLAHVRR